MEILELKFLLKLLGFPEYRAPLSNVNPNSKTKAVDRNRICRTLRDRELVGCEEEVKKLTIAPPGQSLLEVDPATLPITNEELKALKASAKGTIPPGETGISAEKRQAIIQSLANRGFIKVVEKKITKVWLSDRGKEFLLNDYEDFRANVNINLTAKMLSDYLQFLRKFLSAKTSSATPAIHESQQSTSVTTQAPEPVTQIPTNKPNDIEILQLIQTLDRELATENYLPLFHLRQKLQPPLSRQELDRALYRLEGEDKISFSSLEELSAYTPEQIEAGIHQDFGGPLFFIIVN